MRPNIRTHASNCSPFLRCMIRGVMNNRRELILRQIEKAVMHIE